MGRAEGAAAASLKPAKMHDADPPAFLLCPITQVSRPPQQPMAVPTPRAGCLQLLLAKSA